MEEGDVQALETIFAQVEDPRVERTKRHRLRDIIILAICGVICGAEGWAEIEEFGKAKEAWFTELGVSLRKLFNHLPEEYTQASLQAFSSINYHRIAASLTCPH